MTRDHSALGRGNCSITAIISGAGHTIVLRTYIQWENQILLRKSQITANAITHHWPSADGDGTGWTQCRRGFQTSKTLAWFGNIRQEASNRVLISRQNVAAKLKTLS